MSRLLCFNVFASTSPQLGVRSIAMSVCVCLFARISQNHSPDFTHVFILDVNCGCDTVFTRSDRRGDRSRDRSPRRSHHV